jgi:hypothetical protein
MDIIATATTRAAVRPGDKMELNMIPIRGRYTIKPLLLVRGLPPPVWR